MMKAAKKYNDTFDTTRDVQPLVPSNEDSVSSLSQPGKHIGTHAKALLKAGQQVHCAWYSRVNLKETKTTMKCLE